ncbi:tryptophan-rich sensory protein [Staphylococcus chromogenes]|nr:tryptophan-rich sensory protein [Staphylococcus chromogenes]
MAGPILYTFMGTAYILVYESANSQKEKEDVTNVHYAQLGLNYAVPYAHFVSLNLKSVEKDNENFI